MASKQNPTHVANGEEYSRAQSGKEINKSTLAQRARREREQILKQSTAVSGKENTQPQVGKEISKSSMGQRARRERERILKQSTADTIAPQTEQHLLRDTRTQPLQEINVGVPLDEHCANIVNNVRNREEIRDTQMADTIAQTRQKSSYADKGKGLLTYAKEKETSLVEPLRERNVGVAIHEERNVNVMRIREVPNGSIISKKSLAQRARRERERNLNQGHSYPSRQRSQLGRTNECLQPIPQADPPSLTPIRRPLNCFGQGSIETQSIQKRQRVAQTFTSLPFMPSTSSTKHTNRPNVTDQVELCCEEDELEVPINSDRPTRTHIIPVRHNLGNMDIQCDHCKALHWMDERLAKSSISNPLFGTCCFKGKIKLPTLITPPPPIRALYDGDDDRSISFRKHAREYNATNAFTSLGATLDPRVLTGRGPISFTIHGELRHRAGSLLPPQGKEASYAQLYIYDPAPALEVRSRRNQHLRKDVLQTIQETLLQVNPFVEKFRQAHAILEQLGVAGQTLPAHLHYSSSKDRRRYNLPTADEIAVVIPGDGTKACGMRDIILHLRGDNQLMQINECHPAYLFVMFYQDNGVQMLKDYISQFYECPYVFIIPAPKFGCLDHCAPVVTFVLKVDWSEECWHIFKGKSRTGKETMGSSS